MFHKAINFVFHPFPMSVTLLFFQKQLNLDRLLARMWEEMGLVRVYTKPQGQQPDFTDPAVFSIVSCIILMLIIDRCSLRPFILFFNLLIHDSDNVISISVANYFSLEVAAL